MILLPPQEVPEDPDFKRTGKTIIKQLVSLRIVREDGAGKETALRRHAEVASDAYRLHKRKSEWKGSVCICMRGARIRNALLRPQEEESDKQRVREFEKEYREILNKAKEEYEYIPASDYYKEGCNLYLRMEKYMSNHLLFLHDRRVPATNKEAERLLRKYKRKQQQAVSFRSFESIEHLCECMSMLVMMRQEEKTNLFVRVSEIFGSGRMATDY